MQKIQADILLALEKGGLTALHSDQIRCITGEYNCLGSDPEFMLLAVKRAKPQAADVSGVMQLAADSLREDPDFMMRVVRHSGRQLEYASDQIKQNIEIVRQAVQQDGNALEYASQALRGQRDVVLDAIRQCPSAIRFVALPLKRTDKLLLDVVFARIRQKELREAVLSVRYGLAEKASPITTTLHRVMATHPSFSQMVHIYDPNAVSKGFCGPSWIQKLPKWLRSRWVDDEEAMITSLKWPCRGTCCKLYSFERKGRRHGCNVLLGGGRICQTRARPNDETCWRTSFRWHQERALRLRGFMVQVVEFCSDSNTFLLGKGQIIEAEMACAMGLKTYQINIASARLAVTAVDWLSLKLAEQRTIQEVVSDRLEILSGSDLVLLALKSATIDAREAAMLLPSDVDVIKEAVKYDGRLLKYASKELRGKPDVVSLAVRQNYHALWDAEVELQSDRALCQEAIAQNPFALQHMPESIREDKDIVTKAIEGDDVALRFASDSLKANQDFVLHIVRLRSPAFLEASDHFRSDCDFMSKVVEVDGRLLRVASPEIRNNRFVVLAAVRNNGEALQFASESMRSDHEIVSVATSQKACAQAYAGKALQMNIDTQAISSGLTNFPATGLLGRGQGRGSIASSMEPAGITGNMGRGRGRGSAPAVTLGTRGRKMTPPPGCRCVHCKPRFASAFTS